MKTYRLGSGHAATEKGKPRPPRIDWRPGRIIDLAPGESIQFPPSYGSLFAQGLRDGLDYARIAWELNR